MSDQVQDNKDKFTELVYCDQACVEIKEKFPQAVFEDASDIVHEERQAVTIPGIDKLEFYEWAVKNGWADLCIGFNVLLRTDKEFLARVKQWLKEVG